MQLSYMPQESPVEQASKAAHNKLEQEGSSDLKFPTPSEHLSNKPGRGS